MDDIIDISESWDGPKKSNNFGDGIELLMNDRKSSGSGGGGNKRPAGPHMLIPLFVGYYLIFKPLKN